MVAHHPQQRSRLLRPLYFARAGRHSPCGQKRRAGADRAAAAVADHAARTHHSVCRPPGARRRRNGPAAAPTDPPLPLPRAVAAIRPPGLLRRHGGCGGPAWRCGAPPSTVGAARATPRTRHARNVSALGATDPALAARTVARPRGAHRAAFGRGAPPASGLPGLSNAQQTNRARTARAHRTVMRRGPPRRALSRRRR